MREMKALVKVGYGCNENCTFCHTLDVRHIDGTDAEVRAKIERAAALGHGMLVLSGGEPTMRPELLEWAALINRLGMDLGLVTNGLMLAYPELVEKLLALRLRYVYQSLHGGEARVHNRLVRADTFAQARAAIGNLAGRGLDYTVNCVVAKQNVNELRTIVDLVAPYTDVALKFSMVQPKGGGEKVFDALTPRVSEVAAAVTAAIRYGQTLVGEAGHARFRHDGIPFCLLPGLEDGYDDLRTHRFATMVEIGEPDLFPVDDVAKHQPEEACGGCALRGPCPGLFAGYHARHGAGELVPLRGRVRPNSWNYVLEGIVATDAAIDEQGHEACPLRNGLGVTPWDRARHLYVRNGPRVARYVTRTRDFADVELMHVKHELGQIYLDVSRKPAPDDFPRDLVKLARSTACTPCPDRAICTGMFEPVFEDLFTRDDAQVATLVAALEGDVLDVGCGDGPYDEALAPAARDGRMRYVGLEPDAERAAKLATRRPWAEIVAGAAETLPDEWAARFDHVLVLRSWNHLADPARALAEIRRALKPGGSLLVVDNVAFGLARSREQTARGEASSAGFEHHQNHGAAEAAAIVTAAGFSIEERRDAAPTSSNQWLLRCVASAA